MTTIQTFQVLLFRIHHQSDPMQRNDAGTEWTAEEQGGNTLLYLWTKVDPARRCAAGVEARLSEVEQQLNELMAGGKRGT